MASHYSVLIVAEDEQVAGLIRNVVESDRLRAISTHNLYQIADFIERANVRPDAAIIDASTWLIEEVIQVCSALSPTMRLLIVSDYATDEALPGAAGYVPPLRLLRKPFSPALLLSTLHELICVAQRADAKRA